MLPAATPFDRELGRLLRACRMARGWSIDYAAGRIPGGMAKATLTSYETGFRPVHVVDLARLAVFYGVPAAELIPVMPRARARADLEHVRLSRGIKPPPDLLITVMDDNDVLQLAEDHQAEAIAALLRAEARSET